MTNISRTPDQIVARIKDPAVAKRDTAGDERSRYLDALDWNRAQEFLRADSGYTEESWSARQIRTVEQAKEEIRKHLVAAWEKANGLRAVSAVRSLCHFAGLLWLIGSTEADEVVRSIEDWDYYGKPQLVLISELIDFDWRSADNGKWQTNSGGEVKTADEVLGR